MAVLLRALARDDLGAIRTLLGERCDLSDAAIVADETFFGAAPGHAKPEGIAAFDGGRMIGVVASSGPWLRILAVDPAARGRGVGTSLLAWAESAIAGEGHQRSRTLAQPGNYLAPGVPEGDLETLSWLERRGYEAGTRNTNLLIELEDNPKVTREQARERAAAATARGYRIARAAAEDAQLVGTVGASFSPAWAFEIERALGGTPAGVHLAIEEASGQLAAFAAHDGNNRGLGWFGPAGTMAEHRGRGLGAALLLACLVDVAEAGHKLGVIAWIGPREFYQRVAGVSGERHYRVLAKTLAQDADSIDEGCAMPTDNTESEDSP